MWKWRKIRKLLISSHSRSDLFVEYVNKSYTNLSPNLAGVLYFGIFFKKLYLLYIGTERVLLSPICTKSATANMDQREWFDQIFLSIDLSQILNVFLTWICNWSLLTNIIYVFRTRCSFALQAIYYLHFWQSRCLTLKIKHVIKIASLDSP
jgi:hypothetical protein